VNTENTFDSALRLAPRQATPVNPSLEVVDYNPGSSAGPVIKAGGTFRFRQTSMTGVLGFD
jgi:hypothetical protein